jgi:CBS domain-containing protein
MRRHRIRHLPVLDGERLVGILSERDLLARVGRDGDGAIEVWIGIFTTVDALRALQELLGHARRRRRIAKPRTQEA